MSETELEQKGDPQNAFSRRDSSDSAPTTRLPSYKQDSATLWRTMGGMSIPRTRSRRSNKRPASEEGSQVRDTKGLSIGMLVRSSSSMNNSDKLLTTTQSAAYLGMTYKQFRRVKDDIPCHRFRGGGWQYYWASDLDRWKHKDRVYPPVARPVSQVAEPLIRLEDCPELRSIEATKR